ncbi:hypothetical protein AQJ23_16310 [Streptomyces antibioticus]|nr:hypothetical protein [Streptomyces antibioticus]KUN25449.1 hypothetical protein AQJ23_16310 [Streptomyces antibioticus]
MIEQLRQNLDQADTWATYREQLRDFRKLHGPSSFEDMPSYARDVLHLSNVPSRDSLFKVSDPEITAPPPWEHVVVFLKTCIGYAKENREGSAGVAAHLEEILRLFCKAYIRLGGKTEPRTEPVVLSSSVVPAVPAAAVPGRSVRGAVPTWVRQRPKRTALIGIALAVVFSACGYGIVHAFKDGNRDKGAVAAGAEPTQSAASSSGSGHGRKPSTRPSNSPTGSPSVTTNGGGATGGSTSSTGTGGDTGTGTEGSGITDRDTDAGAADDGSTAGNGGNNDSSPASSPPPNPKAQTFAAVIAWTDNSGGGDPCDCTLIYKDPYDGGGTTGQQTLQSGTPIDVTCKINNGRKVLDVGDDYTGPTDPIRYRIWFKMPSGLWAPAVYAKPLNEGGLGALPLCG